MDINPRILPGPWKAGFALDLHTLSSVAKEWQDYGIKYDTTYTPIGHEMYRLKYRREIYRAEGIGVIAGDFLKQQLPSWNIHLIIPIPPSDISRKYQPVYEIVNHVGRRCNLPIDIDSLKKLKPTSELKRITEPAKRKEVLDGAFSVQNKSLKGKNILLFDDLYRSGETLNAVCNIVTNQGKAKNVYVLTITKTRSKR